MSELDDLRQEREELREQIRLLTATIDRLEAKCRDLLAMLQACRGKT